MKLSCLQENFSRGLNICSRITSGGKPGLPILENVILIAKKGLLELSSTNLEVAITTQVRAKVEKQGKITIPAQLLANYVDLLPNEALTLTTTNHELTIKSKNQKAKIKGISAEEFPIIPQIEKKDKYIIESKNLKDALEKTSFTISPTETRTEISGALFAFNWPKKNILTIVSTDSYRLARCEIPFKKPIGEKREDIIVPLKTIREILRIITNKGDVELYLVPNQILFVYEGTELISRIISGAYPDYEQIIPDKIVTRAHLEKENFLKIIKAASFFAEPGVNDISLEFLPKKNSLLVTSVNDKIGEYAAEVKTEISGQPCKITFNYRYLIDGLANMGHGEISLEIVDSNTPGLIKSVDDPSYLYLIMPIQPR